MVDAEVVDQQTAETVDALTSNDWVDFSGTGALTAATGTALTGGSDGKVETAAYSAFLTNLEPYKFDILIYDGTDTTVQTAMVNFVKRLAEENGQYSQLVAAGLSNADSRFVINVESGVTLSDGAVLSKQQTTWWVGGAQAGALYNQSLTYAAYPGAVAVSPAMTNSQYIAALEAGNFVLFAENGQVKVENCTFYFQNPQDGLDEFDDSQMDYANIGIQTWRYPDASNARSPTPKPNGRRIPILQRTLKTALTGQNGITAALYRKSAVFSCQRDLSMARPRW